MPLIIAATPIGNLKDITMRTLETLKNSDLILCEDTRVTQKLLNHYGISKPLLVYNDFKTPHEKILNELDLGKNIVLVSDAGTPLMSDPGYKLILECQKHGVEITIEPGASAILSAIVLSGFPPYPFYFGGFFDPKKSDLSVNATLIFFEAPHRLLKTLRFLKDIPRHVAVIREISKMYEEVRKGETIELITHFEEQKPRGEIVIVLSPTQNNTEINLEEELEEEIEKILLLHPINEASKILSQMYGLSKKEVYKKALQIKKTAQQ